MQVDGVIEGDGLVNSSEVAQRKHGEFIGSDGITIYEGVVSGYYLGA